MGVDVWGDRVGGYGTCMLNKVYLSHDLTCPPSGQSPGGVERSVSEALFPLRGGPH